MSTQCRFCGEAVRPDSMFCPSCGQLIGMPGAAVPPPFPGTSSPNATPASSAPRAAEPLPPVPLPSPLAVEPAHPASAPPESAPPASAPPAAPTSEPVVERREPAEPVADQAVAPALPTTVALPDGQRLGLDRVLVFGRSPERGAPAHHGHPVRLDDPERAMSRVHLVLAPTAGAVIATDPGSANGTLLERGGTKYALVAGTPSALLPGDRLLLGDAVLVIA